MTIQAQYIDSAGARIALTLGAGDAIGDFTGPANLSISAASGSREYEVLISLVQSGSVSIAPYMTPTADVPDNPTLGDWRVGLVLWTRKDAGGNTVNRLADVTAAVQALIAAGNPLGAVAQQRLEYSNNVQRAELLQLKGVFGFTAADVDESLYRAHQVSLGDLSGVWPLPAAA